MATNFNIKWDSTPDLDEWGVDDYWSLNDWIKWHKALKEKYKSSTKYQTVDKFGDVEANAMADGLFLTWWKKQSALASPINELDNDITSESFNYIKKNILLYIGTGAFYADYNPYNPQSVYEHIIVPVGEGIGTGLKVLKWVVIGGLVLGAVLVGSIAYGAIKDGSWKNINPLKKK